MSFVIIYTLNDNRRSYESGKPEYTGRTAQEACAVQGKYPRNYKEKYKELNPEKYQDTIEKVIRKGSTPAGMHISIMVKEIIDFLQIKPGQTGFDATLGYGGHTKAMLECLKGQGHMYATDVDPIESAKTKSVWRMPGLGKTF